MKMKLRTSMTFFSEVMEFEKQRNRIALLPKASIICELYTGNNGLLDLSSNFEKKPWELRFHFHKSLNP